LYFQMYIRDTMVYMFTEYCNFIINNLYL